ncbi:MAG: hypothetical protein ACOH2Q_07160 [Rhodococcus sp. (in: high G+C Gram-positive bacteria)]
MDRQMGMTDPRSAVFERQPSLSPPEFPVVESEPVDVQLRRVQAHSELWDAVVDCERKQRRLDDLVAARTMQRAAGVDPQIEVEARRTERAEVQVQNDRRSRVRLWAVQSGLRYVVQTLTDVHGTRTERHLLTAPASHPDLEREPWEHHTPVVVDGQTVVPGVRGDSLEAVEGWLGLPSDPSMAGTPRRARDRVRP